MAHRNSNNCAEISLRSFAIWRGAAAGGGVEFGEAGHGYCFPAGALVPGLRGEPAPAGVKHSGRKEQSRNHAERSKRSAFPVGVAVLDAINRTFGSKRFPSPAAVEFKAQLIGLGFDHFQDHGRGFGRSGGRRQILAKRGSESGEDAGLSAFAFGARACGEKQIAGVHAIVRKRIAKNKTRFEGRCHREEVFVGFKNKRLGNGKNFAREAGTKSQAAGAKVTAAETKIIGVGSAVQAEVWRRRIGFDDAFAAVVERFDESMTEHAERPVSGKSPSDAPQFSLCPPIIAVEKHDDLAAALGNAGVEGGGLAAVFLADQADARFELANDFRRAVGRTVIHNDDFKLILRVVLVEHAAESLFDEALMVVGVDKNAEEHDCENFRSKPNAGAEEIVADFEPILPRAKADFVLAFPVGTLAPTPEEPRPFTASEPAQRSIESAPGIINTDLPIHAILQRELRRRPAENSRNIWRGPGTKRHVCAKKRTGLGAGQVRQNDLGALLHSFEDDLATVWREVEVLQVEVGGKIGQLALRACWQINEPKILMADLPAQEHQRTSVRHKGNVPGAASQSQRRQWVGSSLGRYRPQRKCGADVRSRENHEAAIRRPRWVDRVILNQERGRTAIEENAEKPRHAVILGRGSDGLTVGCPRR